VKAARARRGWAQERKPRPTMGALGKIGPGLSLLSVVPRRDPFGRGLRETTGMIEAARGAQ